ncbi:MAG: histidine kinase N-terminal 7TM domain-containing protein, partial [Candidatus Omnitrophica bacterium]|nr:histidine kinase N-terminal 7TM domain-containing protein [Candidatus Omnitrophota bacterium]
MQSRADRFLPFLRGKKHSSAKWFAGFTLSAVVWHLGAFMLAGYPISGYDEAFFWWKVAYMGAFFAIAFFFHFIVEYLGLARKHLIFTVYSAAVVFSFFNWYHGSRYFLGDIYFVFDKFYWIDALKYKNSIWLFFYVSFYWVALGYGFYLLLNALKDSSAARRNKLRYLILASGFGWIGTNPLFLPAFHVAVYPYTNFFVATYPLLVAYAVVRHHVMDIEFVIKKTIVFAG